MSSYFIELENDVLHIGFGDESAQNDRIVRDIANRLQELKASGVLKGGPLLKVNGPASLPAACTLVHGVAHLYGAIGMFDPKLGKYVISITHNPDYELGDLVD
jgi:CRISPR-associated protein Csx3